MQTEFNFDELQLVHSKEIKKSHSCGSNRELKYADLLGVSQFGKFERILTSYFDVGSLAEIDILSPKFFETWTVDSEEILKIKGICEQSSDCIKGDDIQFEYTKCRYKGIPFIIGTWNNSKSSKVGQRYPKCLLYVKKKTEFQSIFDELVAED